MGNSHIRQQDREWIDRRIEEKLRSAAERPEVQGFKRFAYWLREWSLVGTAITVILTLIGLLLTAIYFSVSGVRTDAEFRGKTDERLKTIESRLTGVEGPLKVFQAQAIVGRYSGTSPQELKTHRSELAQAKAELATTPRNVPSFWPVSFQIINLLSQSASGVEPNNRVPEDVISDVSGMKPPNFVSTPGKRILLKNRISDSVFQNAIVRFDPSVQLSNVTFINCVLILPSQDNPPQNIQKIGDQLLAADLSHVTISSS